MEPKDADRWWRGALIYQIYPRSFADASGDGVGDLRGIADRLDYVAGLGVDGIWLSPIFVSPMKDFGYDVADYRDVDPLFGTLADLDLVIDRAHRLGLKIIIDQVYSHSSDRHPWFRESRESRTNDRADWYVWADPKPDGSPPNNWLAVFGGPAWDWEPRRRQYYLHNFLKEQPDLNFHNRAVQDAMLDVAEFWLRRGIDGFRIDVANFFAHDPLLRDNPPVHHPAPDKPLWLQRPIYNRTRPETLQFVARFRRLLDRYPGTMAVAEIAAEDQIATMGAYTDGPDRYHTAYSFVFLADVPTPTLIRDSVERMGAIAPGAWPSWAFSNHDVVRVVTRAGARDRPALARLLIAVLASLRGTSFLYQGEELGLPQADVPFERLQDPEGRAFWPRHKGRDGARTPMPWAAHAPHAGFSAGFSPTDSDVEPWLPVDSVHRTLAVDAQEADAASTLHFTRRFLAWRRGHPVFRHGAIRFFDAPEGVLSFERRSADITVRCVFNMSAEPVDVPIPMATTLTPLTGHGLDGSLDPVRNVLKLPAYGGFYGHARQELSA